jgi:hypothetical protein
MHHPTTFHYRNVHPLASLLIRARMNIEPEYISIGGNRNPAAADWDAHGSRLLAFGADNSIALWDPLVGGRHCLSFMQSHLLTRIRIRISLASVHY